MDSIVQYWPYIIAALAIAIIVVLVLARRRQRVRLTDSTPVRPHMANAPREGRGLAGVAAAATSDVAGELFGAAIRRELDGDKSPADDFELLKGVGPKFATALHALGFD